MSKRQSSDEMENFEFNEEEIKEKATRNRFRKAQNAVARELTCYWGILPIDLLDKILFVEGTYLLVDAPRSKKLSLRWHLCFRTSNGIEKIEIKHTAGTFILVKTTEKMYSWLNKMKLNPVKRPIILEEKMIVDQKRDNELETVFELGHVTRVEIKLEKGALVEAIRVTTRADEQLKRQLAKEAIDLFEMGNESIQRLWGICFGNESISILLEDVKIPLARNLTERDQLLDWTKQLYSALLYLEQSTFIHRKLTLDVCFLNSKSHLKLAIFCLGSELQVQKLDQEDVDLCRWISWENLAAPYMQWSLKSVVWTFGTLLWSIYHFGATPFENCSAHQIKDISFRKDCELAIETSLFPSNIHKIVKKCWQEEKTRPSCYRLKGLIEKL